MMELDNYRGSADTKGEEGPEGHARPGPGSQRKPHEGLGKATGRRETADTHSPNRQTSRRDTGTARGRRHRAMRDRRPGQGPQVAGQAVVSTAET